MIVEVFFLGMVVIQGDTVLSVGQTTFYTH